MKRDLLQTSFSFKLPSHTYRLQRSNHSGTVRMLDVKYVEARMMTTEGHFTETLFNMSAAAMSIDKIVHVYTHLDAPYLCKYN